ncbi:tetratricopeptide repeat protein [Pseudomarimonas salicorniae]|uniref:Sel1 repeat family protein n=1 Tax=Pseudomarimonas salicorniae TaxID=2933270 RepID=A0ABT0GMV6_9GAMM|nr:tetratricopeptide repeat protein [Lysobacter sp. CAU 1642]MCK7595332.1 sel1 repeat family protein [Lysobacter sp. CAU 1642]
MTALNGMVLAFALLFTGAALAADEGSAAGSEALRQAAEAGDPRAATALAEALVVEAGGRAGPEVIALLEQGAKAEVPRALALLGAVYLFGAGVPADAARAIPLLESAAASGDNEARVNLAVALEHGAGVERDLERALSLLREAAEDGFPPGMHGVGVYHLKGLGVAQDRAEAQRWFERGAEAGHADSSAQLAELLLDGEHLERDVERALALLERAVAGGSEGALMRLVLVLVEGEHVPPDPARARALLQRFAETGHARSAVVLGQMLLEGQYVPAEPEVGAAWIRQAAETGLPNAQYLLARAYESGSGVERDLAQYEQWMRRAAAGGYAAARLALTSIEFERAQRESLPPELVARIREAAEAGEAGAAFELGMLARYGRGLARDRDAARRWLLRAAEAGVVAAQRELGEMDLRDKDPERQRDAVRQLQRAADAGDAGAQYLLGRALQFGHGLRARPGKARKHFQQAALQGHDEAGIALAQTLWNGSPSDRDLALAWLLLPPGDEGAESLEHRALEYARGETGETPADPAFGLLLAAIATELGRPDAGKRYEDIAARLDAGQRRRVAEARSRWHALRAKPHAQWVWREAMVEARALRWDDAQRAAPHAARAVEAARKAFGARSLPHAEALELVASLADMQEEDALALRSYDRALDIRLALQPADHPDILDNRRARAWLADPDDLWAARAEALAALLPRAERRHGAGSAWLRRLYEGLGNALYFADRSEEAVPHLRRALALALRDPDAQDAVKLAEAREDLARALAETGAVAEAISLLHEGLSGLREAGPEFAGELKSPLERLALTLWQADRHEEAAEAQSELIALLEAEQPEALGELGEARRLLEVIRASAYASDPDVPPDRQALEAAAETGDGFAQLRLADLLLRGDFGSVDAKAAAHWYRRSAENGEAIAQYNLAILLGEGRGVAPDRAEAVEWLKRSAAQGFAEAQATLGFYLTDGEGEDDVAEAVRLFEQAAGQGSAVGKFNLSNHLIDGEGVAQDIERGLGLLRAAADQGLPEAIRALGLLQITGEHVPKDAEQGRGRLLQAARLGDGLATSLACSLARHRKVDWMGSLIEAPEREAFDPELLARCEPAERATAAGR